MYSSIFDNYFQDNFIKDHNDNNWNYWRFGKELDRYEIYKVGLKDEFKMIIPLKYESLRIYYRKLDDLVNHLNYLKKDL